MKCDCCIVLFLLTYFATTTFFSVWLVFGCGRGAGGVVVIFPSFPLTIHQQGDEHQAVHYIWGRKKKIAEFTIYGEEKKTSLWVHDTYGDKKGALGQTKGSSLYKGHESKTKGSSLHTGSSLYMGLGKTSGKTLEQGTLGTHLNRSWWERCWRQTRRGWGRWSAVGPRSAAMPTSALSHADANAVLWTGGGAAEGQGKPPSSGNARMLHPAQQTRFKGHSVMAWYWLYTNSSNILCAETSHSRKCWVPHVFLGGLQLGYV